MLLNVDFESLIFIWSVLVCNRWFGLFSAITAFGGCSKIVFVPISEFTENSKINQLTNTGDDKRVEF